MALLVLVSDFTFNLISVLSGSFYFPTPPYAALESAGRLCVFFKGQHIGALMGDDSFPFLIAMVPVAWLPGGGSKGADTNIL